MHANDTRAGGHDQRVAGVNLKWPGSIHHHQKTNSIQLRWRWLPELQQWRHLSWQLPLQPTEWRSGPGTAATNGSKPVALQRLLVTVLALWPWRMTSAECSTGLVPSLQEESALTFSQPP
jgi:hypothetical protein